LVLAFRESRCNRPRAYINTSAAVKAESDYCCTSANATKVVSAIPADKPILFLPDKFLASVVAQQTRRSNIFAYPGYCHVHKTIRPEQVVQIMEDHPDIDLLLHPECGCVSSCMAKAVDGGLPAAHLQKTTFSDDCRQIPDPNCLA
jgi:quinolinate synthase